MIPDANFCEILVVDDTPDSLRYLTQILEKRGYLVRAASEGSLALQSVEARLPDLILLDVKMEEVDGYEVCRRLKSDDSSRNVPVIFISGLHETFDKVKGFKAGGVDFITKPFEPEEVLARVETHLRLRQLTDRLEQEVSDQTEKLRESEKLYRTLFENAGDAIIISDFNTRFLAVNKAACERLGYSRQELLRMTPLDITAPEYADLLPERIEQVRRQGGLIDEWAGVRCDGTVIPVEVNSRPIEYDGQPAVMSIIRDITARKQAEEKLIIESQKELIANVSHELYTPISRIRVALSMAVEDDFSIDREQIEGVMEDLSDLEEIVQDVLIAARRDLGEPKGANLPVKLERLNPRHFLNCCARRLGALYRSHELNVDFDDNLPEIMADPILLNRVVTNLIDNASKYSPDGTIITLRARSGEQKLLVEIADQGIGIDESDLKQVFHPFFRAEKSRCRSTGGVGLGLTICLRIIQAHHGEIDIQNTSGQGTSVRIVIPAIPAKTAVSN